MVFARRFAALLVGCAAAACGPEWTPVEARPGLWIQFDYRFDRRGFFDAPEHRAALEFAAAAWRDRLADEFDEMPRGTTVRIRDPEDIENHIEVTLENGIDDMVVFVGSGWPLNNTAIAMIEVVRRWTGDYFRPAVGCIQFNANVDWFVDPTPATDDDIPVGSADLIATAIHEIGHLLGFTPHVLQQQIDEEDRFIGDAATHVYLKPVPLADLMHFGPAVTVRGVKPAMGTTRSKYVRLLPSPLDMAVLSDIGYHPREF